MRYTSGSHDPRTLVPSEIERTAGDIRWNLTISAEAFSKGRLLATTADGLELRIVADSASVQHVYLQQKDGSGRWYGLARIYAARLRFSSSSRVGNIRHTKHAHALFSSLTSDQIEELIRRARERTL